ncbi:hypothetical protein DL93DRAFT_2155586 [Clavulina sp. PMI_390]|nr:hypothetical protein DL93DRAFT_2155586 [Clavulina sp. PMI_390]
MAPLRDAFFRADRAPMRAIHSTPPPLTSSSATSSVRSTASTERFAASLQGSRRSLGSSGKKAVSFDVSKIEHASLDENGSLLMYDEHSRIAAPDFGVPVGPEHNSEDASLSDPLESISLSSSSKKTEQSSEVSLSSASSRAASTRSPFHNVTQRRAVPLRDDFINASMSLLNNSPLARQISSPSPPLPQLPPSPPLQDDQEDEDIEMPSLPQANISLSDLDDDLPSPQPTRSWQPRAAHLASSGTQGFGSLASIREESRSYEEPPLSDDGAKTPVARRIADRSRFSSSRSSDEGNFAGHSSSRKSDPGKESIAEPMSAGGTPDESPPTRLYQPRSFAKLNIQAPSEDESDESHVGGIPPSDITATQPTPVQRRAVFTPRPRLSTLRSAYVPSTPANHHKSFLLSLASTAKGTRFALPTPHPNVRRPRLSHPIMPVQSSSPAPTLNDGDVSKISNASSNDFVRFDRGNTSFDPTADAKPKFNHNKLNNYLSDLNTHLMEENEALNMRLAEYEAKLGISETQGDESVGVTPRSSSLRSALSPGSTSRGAAASTAMMNDLVAALQEELEQAKADRDEAQARTEKHLVDQQLLDDRAQEVRNLVRELEDVQADCRRQVEIKDVKIKQIQTESMQILADSDAELNAEREKVAVLEERLQEGARESQRVQRAEEQADAARDAKLVAEQAQADAERQVREITLERNSLQMAKRHAEDQLRTMEQRLEEEREAGIDASDERAIQIEEEQRRLRVALEAQLAESQSTIAQQNARVAALEEDLASSEERTRNARDQVAQTELAVREAQKQMTHDAEELCVLGSRIAILTEERDRARADAAKAKSPSPLTRRVSGASTISSHWTATTAHSDSDDNIPLEEHQRIVEDYEARLDDAEREIGRLELEVKDTTSSQALVKARQMRIDILEKENGELNEKVVALREALQPFADSSMSGVRTPRRGDSMKGLSTPRERTLRTPGAAAIFADYTMFQNTMKDGSVDISQYLARFEQLDAQLEVANDKLDGAIEQLGSAGVTRVELTDQVHELRARVGELEKEISEMTRNEERIRKRLQRCKCTRCSRRFDASGVVDALNEPSVSLASSVNISMEDPSRSRAALQSELERVNAELAGMKKVWTSEKQSLVGEQAALRDTATRLMAQVKAESAKTDAERKKARDATRRIQDDGERQKAIMQLVTEHIELDAARSSISILESELKQERTKLRSLNSERNNATREMTEVMNKLESKQADLDEVKRELARLRMDNRDLDDELQRHGEADNKAKRLAAKIAENQKVVERLREERDALTRDHQTLQSRYAKVSEQTNSVRQQLIKYQSAHDERRHQLDVRIAEIEDLRQTIQEQAAELQGTESERMAMMTERTRVAQAVSLLEADLHRVRRESDKIRRDVKQLREERATLMKKSEQDHIVTKRSQAQLHRLQEEVVDLRKKLRRSEDSMARHVCAADEQTLRAMQRLHREHCQSFMRRIHYLKARIIRELGFRSDLAYQKQHLMGTIQAFEKTEKNVVLIASRLGIRPRPSPRRRKRTLRSVATAVIFLCRTRNASDMWRQAKVDRDAVVAGYELARGHPLRK